MLNKTSSKLADGTRIEDLIDVERREVSARVLSDPEIYHLELERIFGRAWLLLGHDTEIPKSGDYVVRDMGEDQVIVVGAHYGLKDWLAQRITAIVMAVGAELPLSALCAVLALRLFPRPEHS